jgi:hypothetical protein
MLEKTPTRRARKPAVAAKKAAPRVTVETAPIGGNGEVLANQGENAANLIDPIRDLVNILAENIKHNTELLKQFDRPRAEQTGDRPPVVEQLRTILDYKAIGQMTGRNGSAFQGNLILALRQNTGPNEDFLHFFDLPDGAANVSVQVDGDQNPKVFDLVVSEDQAQIPDPAVGKDIGRIEILNSELEPISLGPRMVVRPQPQNTR